MKFGCCAGIEQAEQVYKAGFDFIECTVVSLQAEENDQLFKSKLSQYQQSPVPVEAFNVFLPGDLQIVGENLDWERIRRYIHTALERVKQIGAEVVVFGSGKARSLPEGFSAQQGEEQILQFLESVADVADPLGLTFVIEPLNKKESNLINSVPEALELAQKVNRPSIRVLADFYHMDEEEETLEHLVQAADYLGHIHVADTGRLAPGTGSYPYPEFVRKVAQAGYSQRISVECRWVHFEQEAASARAYLQHQFL